MTVETKNPNVAEVTQTSSGPAQINDRLDAEESANHGILSVEITSTSKTLTSAEFWEAYLFTLTTVSPSPGADVSLFVPANERGKFAVYNTMFEDVYVSISGQSDEPPLVPYGRVVELVTDGTNVRYAHSYGVNSEAIRTIKKVTQAEFDAESPAADDVLYVVVG